MQIWETLAGAFFGSLVAASIVGYLTQQWIERRERRKYRDELRLKLYVDVVALIIDNEEAIATKSGDGDIAPVDLQKRQISIVHRLKLLGPQHIHEKYKAYKTLVFRETGLPVEKGPVNPDDVVRARDGLIAAMADDVQDVPKKCFMRLCRD